MILNMEALHTWTLTDTAEIFTDLANELDVLVAYSYEWTMEVAHLTPSCTPHSSG